MIEALAEWAAAAPVPLVVAAAVVAFLAALAVLLVMGVAAGVAIARLASAPGRRRNR